MYTIVYTCYNN